MEKRTDRGELTCRSHGLIYSVSGLVALQPRKAQ